MTVVQRSGPARAASRLFLGLAVVASLLLASGILLTARSTGTISRVTWLGIPGFMLMASLVFWRLKPGPRENAAIAVLVTGMTLLVSEIAVAALFPHLVEFVDPECRGFARCQLARDQGLNFDKRTTAEVMTDLRAQGIQAWPGVYPITMVERSALVEFGDARALPLTGISRATTIHCNESGTYEIFQSDEHGFNNPSGLHRPGQVQVAILGDSFAEGHCVPRSQSAAGRLRKQFPETLSFGKASTGPLVQLAILREYVQRLAPKTVLWFFHEGNDLVDLQLEIANPQWARYIDNGFHGDLANSQARIDSLLSQVLEDEWLSRTRNPRPPAAAPSWRDSPLANTLFLRRIRTLAGRLVTASTPQPDAAAPEDDPENLRRLEDILAAGAQYIRGWGGRMYLVYLPEWNRYARPAAAKRARPAVLALAGRLGIAVIDLHPRFQASDDPLAFFPFRVWGHYNADGYALVASTIVETLHATTDSAVR